jgi:methylmalonyl-CoA/ethylmalonyl-CoA epimerase
MSLKKLDHLGIAVNSIEEALPLWVDGLGLKFIKEEVVEDQKVRVAVLSNEHERIELLEPTSEDSPIAKFLKKRGPGIHHSCFLVDNIKESLADLKNKGFVLIDEEPKLGVGGCQIAFVHPKSCGGTLIELKEIR